MGSIYVFENRTTGKRYVGMTSRDLSVRACEHVRKGSKLFRRAIQKYGIDDFDLVVSEYAPDDKLKEFEIAAIAHHETRHPAGYNISAGGNGGNGIGELNTFYGRKHSEETKRKMSKAHKGNKSKTGQTLSDETKKRISEARRKGGDPIYAGPIPQHEVTR